MYPHYRGALANYKGSPFAIGSKHVFSALKTEILGTDGKWVEKEEYNLDSNSNAM